MRNGQLRERLKENEENMQRKKNDEQSKEWMKLLRKLTD